MLTKEKKGGGENYRYCYRYRYGYMKIKYVTQFQKTTLILNLSEMKMICDEVVFRNTNNRLPVHRFIAPDRFNTSHRLIQKQVYCPLSTLPQWGGLVT